MTSFSSLWLPALFGLTLSTRALAQDPQPSPLPQPQPEIPALPRVQLQAAPAPQQRTGRIVGRILEEGSGQPVPGAQVGIAMGGISVSSGIDGRFTLLNVPAGPTAITVRAIGFSPKTVSGVEVPAGGVVQQDVTIGATAVEVEGITVAATQERGSVAAALEEQRTSTNITNAVTAEEISRSPDADAAQALQRVSGVTVQDGRYVFVRGLGERYTTTSLNNARLPSPEPERKVVPLDLFPSSLLEAVTTSKTFTPDQSGDFSGAQVNLRTREFNLGRVMSYSLSMGYNDAVTGRAIQRAPATGSEWYGMPGSARTIPAPVQDAGDLRGTTNAQIPGLVGSFRNVWNAEDGTGAPNAQASFSLGGEDPFFGHLVGYVASLSYGYNTEIHRNEERALGVSDGAGGARPYNAYRGESVTGSVLWGGIFNLSSRFGSSTKLTFNNTYNRSGDNTAVRAAGANEEFARDLDVTRLQYVSRSVRSNQLSGEHLIGHDNTITWAVTSSGVTRNEPDRSDLAYTAAIDTAAHTVTPVEWFSAPKAGTRTFSDLSESSWQADGGWRLALSTYTALKFGGQFRTVDRNADSRSYDILNQSQTDTELSRPAEQVFDDTTKLTMLSNANGGRYEAADRLGAFYGQAELPLSHRLRLIGGARVEVSQITVDTRTVTGTVSQAKLNNTDLLPGLSLQFDMGGNHQLRLAASQTLSRPEYRELSNVCYFEILGSVTVCGNNQLHRALIQNADARWEFYPSHGEVISLGLFAKHFSEPIERVLVGTTGANTATFINTHGATNYGLEVEFRKSLGMVAPALQPFSVALNGTLMKSEIDLGSGNVSSLTSQQRAMVGQAPYVVNAALGYLSGQGRFNATVLYNIVGRRIVEAGVQPVPDTYEEARSVLDASMRLGVSRSLSLKLDGKNLLDTPFHITQGAVTRLRYTVGRTVSAGVTWEP